MSDTEDPTRTTSARVICSDLITQALVRAWPQSTGVEVLIDRPKDVRHGDYSCNVALQLARLLRRAPREIAVGIVAALPPSPYLAKAEVAGAGFINLFLTRAFKQAIVSEVLQRGAEFGNVELPQAQKVQVEFVSANPTGPLHVGHGRGAAYGASLANILAKSGFDVSREYYVNDAGRQMDILALSTWLRYLELAGEIIPFPANAYQGEYVRSMAQAMLAAQGTRFVKRATTDIEDAVSNTSDEPEAYLDALIARAKALLGPDYEYLHDYVLNAQLADCRADLTEFGVMFDNWFSERSLFTSGCVERVVTKLSASGHTYTEEGALWFRSRTFGDEKDRVIRRENGQFTYFASDIAYHVDKFERGYDLLINVWGADHHGYIARVKGALVALGLDADRLSISLVQFAVLYRHGEKVSMSTRAGEFVTLRELRSEVGNDAARFFYVLRKSDQHLDFDLDLAKSQSNENPVYYVQYAHARVCSLLEQWGGDMSRLLKADTLKLDSEHELAVLERMSAFSDVLESAARDYAPHLIAFYLKDLAADFHSYYNATRILVEDEELKLARLALATAVRQVLRNGLSLLGVSAPEKM